MQLMLAPRSKCALLSFLWRSKCTRFFGAVRGGRQTLQSRCCPYSTAWELPLALKLRTEATHKTLGALCHLPAQAIESQWCEHARGIKHMNRSCILGDGQQIGTRCRSRKMQLIANLKAEDYSLAQEVSPRCLADALGPAPRCEWPESQAFQGAEQQRNSSKQY